MLHCIQCLEDKEDKEFTLFKRNPSLKSRKGRIVFCKSCVAKYVTMKGNTKQALREICQLVDIPFIDNLADSALKQFNKKKKKNNSGITTKDQNNIFGCYARFIGVMNQNYINYSYSDGIRDDNLDGKINKLEQLKQDLIPTEVIEQEKNIKRCKNHLIKIFGEETVEDENKLMKVVKIKFDEFDAYGDNSARSKKYQLKKHLKYLVDVDIYNKKKFSFLYDDIEEEEDNDEKVYSKEWKGYYTQDDLNYLNDYYEDLNTDFKIITRNHKDYARKIAKASLAMDKAFEDMQNGIAGADKRYKDFKDSFDTLSKSAQFAENTRGQNDVALGCFGKVFEVVENHNWIPEWEILEKDQLDVLLDQFSNIDKSL